MNANEITFGVEIETTIPRGAVNVGGYHNPLSVAQAGMPQGWQAKSDGSIEAGAGRMGCEFVSPILRGAEGIASVVAAVAKIKELGGTINESTGLHIHVGWTGDDKALGRLTTLVANFETAIFATTGSKRRQGARWCKSMQRHGNREVARTQSSVDRYHVLNLTNLRPGGKKTVEFRAFAGTLNVVKIIGYVRMCVGLVERAHKAKRVTNWTAKPVKDSSPIHRSGAGQTAVARLFYQLGWVKGRTQHTFGDVTHESAPSAKSIKKEFMRLAKKYDRGDETAGN